MHINNNLSVRYGKPETDMPIADCQLLNANYQLLIAKC